MALPKSSLSQVCRAIADFIGESLGAHTNSFHVTIGSPATAAQAETENQINLFFYRIEPAGLFTGDSDGDPWWVRLQCLVTGFGVAEEKISSGENDLRLLGEVMRLFHEHPVQPALTVEGETFRVQAVFLPLSADDLNHIWTTQGDVCYRPSVVYEFAVIPVVPLERAIESPLAGSIGSETRAAREARTAPFGGEFWLPPVLLSTVDASSEGWAPVICFVSNGQCACSLAFKLGSSALQAFAPRVWVAGDPGASVSLAWQRWTRGSGWQDVAGATVATASTATLDPDNAGGAVLRDVALPPGFSAEAGQAVLYAARSYLRSSDQAEITVRSNPLLVSVYGGA
jgi:hypothetical protein